jgi:4-amino-4-deoxy-L-arabinose transferase-like glycosyltransferase
MATKNKYPWAVIIPLMVFYFLIILKLVNRPLIGWEVIYWEQALRVYKQGAAAVIFFLHPTFYAYLGALCFKLFGISEASFRVYSIFSFLGTLLLLPVLVRCLLRQEKYTFPAVLSVLLFALSPLAVQGSLINDITDTGLLVLATVAFFVAYYALYEEGLVKKIILLGIVYGFCLCAKITTSLALPLSIFVFSCLRKKWREAAVLSLGIFIVGVLVFSLVWFLNCFFTRHTAEFLTPCRYAFSSFRSAAPQVRQGLSEQLLPRILTGFRMGMWLSPFFVLMVAVSFFFQARQFFGRKILHEENQLFIYSLIVAAVYIFANGAVQGGFPKYIAPLVPVLGIYVGITLYRLVGELPVSRYWGVIFAGGFLYYYFIVGDALYPTFLIRKYSYLGRYDILPMMAVFVLKGLLLPLVLTAGLIILKKYSGRNILLVVFISFCASNAATLVAQSRAPYATGLSYGSEGAEKVKEFCLEQRVIYVCQEGVVATGDNVEYRILPANLWQNTDFFYAFLKRERPQSLVYGFACNTIAQMRLMATSPIREYLDQNYHCHIAGDYILCGKNK